MPTHRILDAASEAAKADQDRFNPESIRANLYGKTGRNGLRRVIL